jgi:hypothetical protein
MLDERSGDFNACIENHGEDAGRERFGGGSLRDEFCNELACTGVRGMSLDDDRAACGKGGCRVSASDGEGEREVGGSEDGDGAKRAQHGAEIGARERLAIGECGVNASLDPGAFFKKRGKDAELVGGAGGFSGETRGGWECGFEMGAFDEYSGVGVDGVCDAAEKCCTDFTRKLAVDRKCFRGGLDGGIQFSETRGVVRRRNGSAGLGVDGVKSEGIA